ncbi:LpqB family beta-propeller domain-containing protein [Actinokineospora enzanensis]|uniref:LpqB family beta-propeller domain-containing protein n=1 Tax=Actinokineospora enzanensis TaxID=155975 RepID=UPI00037186BA|nr:LpqB family beta-propeller domain-containing protein [Actinokineospora enzanensis]
MNRTLSRLGGILLCVLGLAGCANIPDRTLPRVIVNTTEEQPRQIGKPAPGLDPFSLVQQFVFAAGNSDVARTYLTDAAAQSWKGAAPPTIIKDQFKTLPQSVQDRGDSADHVIVVLSGDTTGNLTAESVYATSVSEFSYRVVVSREDGQWRISEPPPVVLITESDFQTSYRRVNLEFFDNEQRVLVPDPRYVEIEPRRYLYGRVVTLLLLGPSMSLRGAVRSQLDGVELSTNVVEESTGEILVNLAKVDKSAEDKQRIAAQLVYSLREVTTSPLRLRSQGAPLIPGQEDWTVSDVGSYDALTALKPDLLGLVVSNNRLKSLRDGKDLDGPAGNGAYDIASAAQSLDGSHLAVVQRVPNGVRLRVGRTNEELPEISLPEAHTLTRPTWLFSAGAESGPSEVWTVQDGTVVVRVVRTAAGSWKTSPVDASELTANEGTITQLRLSRDGARVAAVVNGEVRVASVVRNNEAVSLRVTRTLQGNAVKDVIGLDWLDRLTVIAATSRQVVSLPIDGYGYNPYNNTNLTNPITAITAAPGRAVIVTDNFGMWSTQEPGKLWQTYQYNQPPGSTPFYPG